MNFFPSYLTHCCKITFDLIAGSIFSNSKLQYIVIPWKDLNQKFNQKFTSTGNGNPVRDSDSCLKKSIKNIFNAGLFVSDMCVNELVVEIFPVWKECKITILLSVRLVACSYS